MEWHRELRRLYIVGGKTNSITLKTEKTMRNYVKPEFEIFEVAVEGGYGDSIALPGFGSENDELVY